MLLFVGLGNPTPDSENNRHNVGFKIIDSINKKFSLSKQKPKFKGLLTTGNIGDEKVYAIKPLTFMNNSGICIRDRFPVVKRPLNLGFCFDRLNSLFIVSIILKPTLCRLFSLSGVGFPNPTNKSIN